MVSKAKKSTPPPPPYEPTKQEREAVERVFERGARKAPAPRFKLEATGDKSVNISADHPEPAISYILLADALGTGNHEFASGLLAQFADVARSGKVATNRELNFMLSVVQGINPKDETEALLAAQMAAIHDATIVAARRLKHVETVPQQDSASNMLNKLARTFAAQVEALKKYRSTGEQTIKVQHVTVNEGGQAIVGDINRGGGDETENGGQPHEPCRTDERCPALLGHEQALATGMPSAGSAGLECVPVSRGRGRGAKR
jgi:hypothetical protein